MGLVHNYNKKTGVTYIYEATNFWDREKRRTRSVRRLVGKLDPASGDIILTGRKGKPGQNMGQEDEPLTISQGESEARARIVELEAVIRKQQEMIWHLQRQNAQLSKTLKNISALSDRTNTLIAEDSAAFAEQQGQNAERDAAILAENAAAAARGVPVASTQQGDLLGENALLPGGDAGKVPEGMEI